MQRLIIACNWLVALWVVWMLGRPLASAVVQRVRQAWRRRRYRTQPGIDALQAAVNEHAEVMAPDGALAAAVVTPSETRRFFAGRIDGRDTPAADADTRFEIGSISKTFTATLLSSMARAGLLALDTTLDELSAPDEHLGRQSPRPITLEDLATHHSGLPRLPWGLPMLRGALFTPSQPYRFLDERNLRQWMRGRRVSRVGSTYRYSNLGYMVLSRVLARRAGLDFMAALRAHVLDPLGLRATSVTPDRGTFAQPHTTLGWRTPSWRRGGDLQGAGGLRSSLTDMIVWLQANLHCHDPVDERMHAPVAPALPGRRVALAWQISGDGDATLIWHNGATGGSRSFIGFLPTSGVGVVVLSAQAVSVDALGVRLLQLAARTVRPE